MHHVIILPLLSRFLSLILFLHRPVYFHLLVSMSPTFPCVAWFGKLSPHGGRRLILGDRLQFNQGESRRRGMGEAWAGPGATADKKHFGDWYWRKLLHQEDLVPSVYSDVVNLSLLRSGVLQRISPALHIVPR